MLHTAWFVGMNLPILGESEKLTVVATHRQASGCLGREYIYEEGKPKFGSIPKISVNS